MDNLSESDISNPIFDLLDHLDRPEFQPELLSEPLLPSVVERRPEPVTVTPPPTDSGVAISTGDPIVAENLTQLSLPPQSGGGREEQVGGFFGDDDFGIEDDPDLLEFNIYDAATQTVPSIPKVVPPPVLRSYHQYTMPETWSQYPSFSTSHGAPYSRGLFYFPH